MFLMFMIKVFFIILYITPMVTFLFYLSTFQQIYHIRSAKVYFNNIILRGTLEDTPFFFLINLFIYLFIYLFMYLFWAELTLHCCTWAFSSCGKQGLLFVAVHGLLIAVTSLVAEHGLQVRGLQQLWQVGSVVVAHELSCSAACGIFLEQGLNPCPLHWQADS